MSIPRSKSKPSTLQSDGGSRRFIITTRLITSGDEWKYLKGVGALVIRARKRSALPQALSLKGR